MERKNIISKLKEKFDLMELVCPHTWNKFKDLSWQFLDTELLETLMVLRFDIIKKPMSVNDWHVGGHDGVIYDERGLRCNICDLCKSKTLKNQIYLTAHANGAGVDFVVDGMTSEEARKLIKANQSLLPYNVRLEKDVAWVHIDVYDTGQKVFEFNG